MEFKDKYRQFCCHDLGIPVFSKDWWLDCVCGKDNWDVVLVEKNEKIVASMPFFKSSRFIFKTISMPDLTQTMGPYIKYLGGQKYESRLGYEKEIMTQLLSALPSVDSFSQSFHYKIENWLPFYWAGYSQTTRYTYVLDSIDDIDAVFSNFSHAKRKNIRRAKEIVNVSYDLEPEAFYENHRKTLLKQGSKISYSKDLFLAMYSKCYDKNCGKIIAAFDKDRNMHAALFVVWDSESAYNLISTIDPDFRNSGSASLLVFEAIKFVQDKVQKFDFEGSMMEGVENSFRQFGAKQKPYHLISKMNSRLYRIYKCLRGI